MFDKKKIKSIVYLAVLAIAILIGFVALIIKVHTIPPISIIQDASVTDAQDDDIYVEMNISKHWRDQGYNCNQYDATVYNNTKHQMNDWKITLTLPGASTINDSWNINVEENDDGTITITNIPDQGFNDFIAGEDKITFGFITFSDGDYPINNFEIEAQPVAKITDYLFFYILVALTLVLIGVTAVTVAIIIKEHQFRARRAHDKIIIVQAMKTFANFIDTKDPYTRGHSSRVAFYTKKIAEKMDFSEEELNNIYYVALLHDVGKLYVPDSILNKPGRLTADEMEIIKTHTTNGATILKDFTSVNCITEGAKYHHERYDGNGYPSGLAGEDIPLIARIIGVADAYDAMNSDRIYRKALSTEKICDELTKYSGEQFDPDIVKIMLELIKDNAFSDIDTELIREDAL